jgi:hypothetical protein
VNWQSPHYQEVKMDAEIGSYQPDGETPSDGYFACDDEAPARARSSRTTGER